MGGISSTESNFNNTFAAVDWSSVITTGLRTAGEGMKDGMESSILGSDAGTSSVRAASTIPNAAGLADILLNIDFDRFTDTISVVCIEEGSLIFEIKADYETIEEVISGLEEQLRQTEAQIGKEARNYTRLRELTEEKDRLEQQLEGLAAGEGAPAEVSAQGAVTPWGRRGCRCRRRRRRPPRRPAR